MKKWFIGGGVAAGIGVLTLVGSFVWTAVAVPALVRYPTDLDVSPVYEGTVTVFLDPHTYAPLDPPAEYPLAVDRRLQALGDESSKDRVVVHETLTLAAPGLFDTTVQEHQYVMDRREMVNVDDPRSWAFTADNPVDRSGMYRLQFPFDADAASYPVYTNETGLPYTATAGPQTEAPAAGIDPGGLVRLEAIEAPQPITDAYRTALVPIVDLPDSLTVEQISPILARAGVDLEGTLAALTPAVDPADLETLLTLAGQPVALSYVFGFEGTVIIDRSTGSIVDVANVTETVFAVPDPSVVTTLSGILAKYPQVPEAVTATEAIAAGDLAQIAVFTNQYHQTDASIVDVYGEISHLGDQRRLAEVTVPRILRISGIVLLILGAALIVTGILRRRQVRPAT